MRNKPAVLNLGSSWGSVDGFQRVLELGWAKCSSFIFTNLWL